MVTLEALLDDNSICPVTVGTLQYVQNIIEHAQRNRYIMIDDHVIPMARIKGFKLTKGGEEYDKTEHS